MKEIFGEAWPNWPEEDFTLIRQRLDFIGVNYYTRAVTRFDPAVWPLKAAAVRQPRATYTETGWEVFPQGLTDILVWIKDRFCNPPVYITENGAAFYDPPVAGEQLTDPLRVDYLFHHLRAAFQAIAAGCELRGYFAWSLLDNFEWSEGFSRRFGLIYVDFKSQKRTPKASFNFLAETMKRRG